ncbi:zinc finger protein ZFP2-like isoform X2 [Plodia interpunctella]|uniref:zinc finger protein ZFP2-like isoform X2 n=1 Tax=Plodia interpunctella TaxID=58824 RepID=UPI002368087B|nr:zinc finger protein ZFP2-like isoform X2 [Plodia interpunctella]
MYITSMKICRACLLTQQDMVALDEFCITNYNLLTNLQIELGDAMPQFFCQNCFNMIKVFADFREKAVTSETSLRKITEIAKPADWFTDEHNNSKNIKTEIWHSDDDRTEAFDNAVFSTEVFDNASCENDLDMKNQLLICALCKREFVDNVVFLEHLKEHKRGGKCKLCFDKVKITDLYAHSHAHTSMTNPEHNLETVREIKLEPSESEHFDTIAAIKDTSQSTYVSIEKKERKAKRAATFKKDKKSKVSVKTADQALLACGLCKMLFDSRELLLQHLRTHQTSRGCSCHICHDIFDSWPQLFAHRMAHLPQKQWQCHLCKYTNSSQIAMEFHYKNLHYDGEDKSLKCKQCSRSYATPRKLNKHVTVVHREKKYICDYCSKGHQTKQHLASHILIHMDIKPYVCDVCGFSCKQQTGLANHKLRKHNPNAISCKLCSSVFADPAKFAKHNCNPTSVVCPHCGQEFSSRRSLTRHLQTHEREARYECARCPRRFRSRGALRVHCARHAGRRAHACLHCGQAFYHPSVLVKHTRIHTGEKPYVCKICHKGFTANNNLKVHMRVHGEYLIVKKNTTTAQGPNPFP